MYRYAMLISAGLLSTLAACTSPTSPSSFEHSVHAEGISAPHVNESYLQADALGATSRSLEVGFFRSADCTDEIVEITGTIHLLFHEQADGSWIGHSNYQGVSGIGLTTGTEFRAQVRITSGSKLRSRQASSSKGAFA